MSRSNSVKTADHGSCPKTVSSEVWFYDLLRTLLGLRLLSLENMGKLLNVQLKQLCYASKLWNPYSDY